MWPIVYIFAIIMQNNKHFWYHLIALIVALIWGETFINSKILILHGMSPSDSCWPTSVSGSYHPNGCSVTTGKTSSG